MKDKERLRDEVSELYPSYDEMYVSPDYETVAKTETISKVLELIDQLDEPEKPVIPKFVAEWYESEGKRRSWWNWFYKWGRDESVFDLEVKTIKWMQDYNEEKFVDMFLHGYTVEEEQKYVVKLPMSKDNDNQYAIVDYSGNIWIDALPSKYKLTEEEIRGLTKGDILFEHFAVKVEELEE